MDMLALAGLTDQMIRLAATGSRAEIARVVEIVAPRVPLMVIARLSPARDQWDAVDDIVQEVLVALTTSLPGLQNPTVGGLRAFLSGIVARRVARFVERGVGGSGVRPVVRSLDSTVASLSGAGPLWTMLTGRDTSPKSAVERAELAGRLIAALGALKSEYRLVITLAFFDQLPMGDVARELGTTRAGAAMLLVRAVRTLRRNLTGSSQVGQPHDAAG